MNTPGSRLCPCGSGLRASRCCSADAAALALTDSTRHLAPLVERAAEAQKAGQTETAEKLCLDILDLAPGHLRALWVLYLIRKPTSRTAAEALLRRIVKLNPNDFPATNELTLLLLNKRAIQEAEIHARNAVRIAPQNPQAHHLMGMILTEANRAHAGEYHYRKVLELAEKRDPIVLANLAWNLKNQSKMEEARKFYKESVELAPNILQTLLGWSRLEEADRNFAEADELLDRAAKLAPDHPSIALARAVVQGRRREYEPALTILHGMAERVEGGRLGPAELLEKGRLLDQMGRYEEAFEAFLEGKRRLREISGQTYLADQAAQQAARLKRFFTAQRTKILPRARIREDFAQPVFILGFPRSGTTLVEQTLTAHPAISAGDELPYINDITGLMPRMLNSPLTYPEALAELWMADQREGLDNLRDYYLQRVRQFDIVEAGARWFTDKMPLNETHIGLISLIFPQSPMIHVMRHPLDVVVSVFSNLLTHGFYCSYDLETVARHYVLTMDLVEHYRAEMTLKYLPIRYEDIVDEQEPSIRRLLDFIGEDFDGRCLSFHENRRYARTASYAQVTERLYDRSRYRYRHYLKQLEPVLPILRPTIERLGYRLDDPI
jgi:Tfp pilus assembly protein PilF